MQSLPRKGLLSTPESETRYIKNDTTVMKSKLSILSTITLSNCNVLSQLLNKEPGCGIWWKGRGISKASDKGTLSLSLAVTETSKGCSDNITLQSESCNSFSKHHY